MKENYQIKLDEIIEKEVSKSNVPTLLLHACCAPCSSYVLEYLSKYFSITILYYNPNINDIDEYNRRLEEERRLIKELNVINTVSLIECDYDNNIFNNLVKGHEGDMEGSNRCFICYEMRLDETARIAVEKGFDYFTTTLSISPHKNSAKLNEIGEALQDKYNTKYLYADFKKKDGYKRSIELSKEFNLYRQDYCGCIYSLNNR